jgi:hypothetical protein
MIPWTLIIAADILPGETWLLPKRRRIREAMVGEFCYRSMEEKIRAGGVEAGYISC